MPPNFGYVPTPYEYRDKIPQCIAVAVSFNATASFFILQVLAKMILLHISCKERKVENLAKVSL
jgi:hypothetical protein